jgi:hypothetical protein
MIDDMHSDIPISKQTVAAKTLKDKTLMSVMTNVKTGHWTKLNEDDVVWKKKLGALSIVHNCLMFGLRVVIPAELRSKVLKLLHQAHPGIVKMKALARSYVWWPRIQEDIENVSKSCTECVLTSSRSKTAELHPNVWPDKPWSRVHIDLAGPFKGQNFLIIMDAYSKWMDVKKLAITDTKHVLQAMREVFANLGIPDYIISDNGPQFVSHEFAMFCKRNGIKHRRVSSFSSR